MNSVASRLSILGISLILMSLIFPAAGEAKIKREDVVAMWLLDEIEDKVKGRLGEDIVKDATGNGHDGVLKNKSKHVDGKFGKALKFNGKKNLAARASYMEVLHHEQLQFPDAVSICAWVIRRKFDFFVHNATPQMILGKNSDWPYLRVNTGFGIGLHEILDHMFFFYSELGWRGAATVPDEEWHHYAAVARQGDKDPNLYIDGELQPILHRGGDNKDRKLTWNDIVGDLHIGAILVGDEFFSENTIDEVAIFNKALAEDDVKRVMDGLERAVFAVSPSAKLTTTWAEIKQSR